jgi:hypothetical protein
MGPEEPVANIAEDETAEEETYQSAFTFLNIHKPLLKADFLFH